MLFCANYREEAAIQDFINRMYNVQSTCVQIRWWQRYGILSTAVAMPGCLRPLVPLVHLVPPLLYILYLLYLLWRTSCTSCGVHLIPPVHLVHPPLSSLRRPRVNISSIVIVLFKVILSVIVTCTILKLFLCIFFRELEV